jgi:hypothetical protein
MGFANRALLSAASLLLIGLVGAAPEATTKPAVNHLKPLEPFAGEWLMDSRWDNGTPLKARAVYAWHLNGKHLRTQTFLPTPDGGEVQRYDGFFSWNAAKGSLVHYSIAVDGGVREGICDVVDEKTLRLGFTPYDASDDPQIRQTMELVSPDEFKWTVEMKQAGEWKRLISASWMRKKG